jgi:hypothetical protein
LGTVNSFTLVRESLFKALSSLTNSSCNLAASRSGAGQVAGVGADGSSGKYMAYLLFKSLEPWKQENCSKMLTLPNRRYSDAHPCTWFCLKASNKTPPQLTNERSNPGRSIQLRVSLLGLTEGGNAGSVFFPKQGHCPSPPAESSGLPFNRPQFDVLETSISCWAEQYCSDLVLRYK